MRFLNIKFILLSVLFFVHFAINAQEGPNLDSTIALKRGFYRTYQEFKDNNPTLLIPATTVIDDEFISIFTEPFYCYKINLIDTFKIEKYTPVWGFCDGVHIYLNREKEFRKRVRYDIIEKMGNYYYFQTTSMTYSPGMYVGGGVGGGGMMMGGGASKTVQQMYFDFATGTEELLTKSKLKKLLQQYPDLLQKFKDETSKSKKLKMYFKLFTEREGS